MMIRMITYLIGLTIVGIVDVLMYYCHICNTRIKSVTGLTFMHVTELTVTELRIVALKLLGPDN
jgi:hypothetical protein